jgi:uncharacterized protein
MSMRGVSMNILRMQLDVDKAMPRPDLMELAEAISAVSGVEALNVTVTDRHPNRRDGGDG